MRDCGEKADTSDVQLLTPIFIRAIGLSNGNGAPSVFRVVGVAEPQVTQLSDGRSVTFQYEPDHQHPGRVVPEVKVSNTMLTGELKSSLGADGSLHLVHPDLPANVTFSRQTNGDAAQSRALVAGSTAAVDPNKLNPQNLAQQDISDIEADSQAAFLQNLTWSLEPSWSTAFLPSAPDFSSDANRVGLVDQDAEWYNSTYAPAFIGYALSSDSSIESKYKLDEQNMSRVAYFLSDDLACDGSYLRQSNASMIPAAIAATQKVSPNLGDYINDASNPPGYWADQLLSYLTTPSQLQLIYDAAPDTTGNMQAQELQNVMQTVNANATLLTVLDPSGIHADEYYNAVYAAMFGGLLQNVTVSQDPTFYQTWLTEFLTQFIAVYNASTTQPPTDPTQLATWSAGEDFQKVAEGLGSVDVLATSIAQAFANSGTTTSLALIAPGAAQSFTNATYEQSPEAGLIAGKYFLVFATAGLFINGLAGLEDLASLSPEQLTSSVNTLVGVMSQLMDLVPDILNLGKWMFSQAQLFLAIVNNAIFSDLSAVTKLFVGTNSGAGSVLSWMKTKVQGSGGATTINTSGTAFSTIMRNVANVGKYVGAMVGVIAFGITVWQLATDIVDGAGAFVIVLDIASAAFAFAGAAASIAGILVESIIPAIVGAAAALGGIVVGAIAQLFQDPPPPNPVDEYLENLATPFANALPDPANAPLPASPALTVGAKVASRLALWKSTGVPKLASA